MLATTVCLLIASASSFAEDPCTDVKAIENFNLDMFASGVWYEIARYPTEWEDHSDCLIATFSRDGDLHKFNITDVFDNTHKLGTFSGDIELATNSINFGVINYVSSYYNSYTGTNKMTAKIVDVDYENYCIFYECRYDANQNISRDHAWILSRSKVLDIDVKKHLQAVFTANPKLDYNKLIWIHFTEEACQTQFKK